MDLLEREIELHTFSRILSTGQIFQKKKEDLTQKHRSKVLAPVVG